MILTITSCYTLILLDFYNKHHIRHFYFFGFMREVNLPILLHILHIAYRQKVHTQKLFTVLEQ